MMYRFGRFSFDADTQQLFCEGQRIPLEPQPAKALRAFLERPGEILSKEDLRNHLWGPDHHVDVDRGLAYCLSELRAALRDSAASPLYIQTLPRRGYRFLAPLEKPPVPLPPPPLRRHLFAGGALAAGVLAAVAYPILRPAPFRLAISLFDNESGDPSLDRWTADLSDLLLVHLSSLAPGRLQLIGNAAPLRRPRNIRNLKVLAQELDVDYILLGQLKRSPSALLFVTHLIRLPGEIHLKANRLTGSADQLPAFERSILAEFERAIRVHVLGEAPK